MKSIPVWVNRHTQAVNVKHIAEIESDVILTEFVCLKMKPKHWIKDTWGDGLWHGWVTAERSDVAKLLKLTK